MPRLCVKCKKQDAYTLNGRAYCAECIKKKNAQERERYAHNKTKEHEKSRKVKERLKSERKCVNCHKPLQIWESHVQCSKCLAKRRRESSERRIKNRIFPKQILRENGICNLCCKNPVVDGKKVCAECLEILVKNLKNANRDNVSHIWRMQEMARIEEVKRKNEQTYDKKS